MSTVYVYNLWLCENVRVNTYIIRVHDLILMLYLNHKLSNQKARFVPRDQAINHGVPSRFPHIIV